ncbi:FAD-dependent oxidoreductase [Anaerosacchariphilus polymeriproducens]|uniref:Pyridine nucleotide-disulfide oxidoreductase n=1 Tax=Anaerosacchariphilus polymeriproducens TaxID=1812858 RepID=A0A371AVN2_9FIRM|nr:FAD-dependent oxidoreductase [Anaerosacchariphilus polymeriproducens]RDU23530.1 pyridine nucleotide-disulfide oxidoreductase [Anaerosacchariphilus polymeriproducens]
MNKKTVIIGGVAGGATAAARLRRRDASMEIVLLERGDYISYANCGLPYYIGDVIKSRDALLLQTPMAMKRKYDIDVRINNEVIKIDPEEKQVTVKDVKTGDEYHESYDNLIIATGSTPIKPPIPGIDSENIFTIWTVPDTDKIKEYIKERKPKSAAIIGGGFIGLEMAENLHGEGIDVSLIEMQDQVMNPLDFEMAQLLHENMRMNQINLILSDGVKSFMTVNGMTEILLNSGKKVKVDMVILSIGIKPNSALAKDAGLELNERGGVVVDKYLKTSNSNIYAVGDVIEVDNYITKNKTMIPLAGPANKQGRIVADNIAGDEKTYEGSLGASIAKVFDLDAASVGINEKTLKAMGKEKNKDYETVLITQKSHAGYYPGATPITLKMIFEKNGKILGGQIVGQEGVDKRIDTLATTIRLNGSVFDLEELELAYAPPFSSAKDPVNMLGFVAENIINGLVSFVEWDEVDELLNNETKENQFTILDVTEDIERMVYAMPKSYHIPLGQLNERMDELDRDAFIIVYCAIGVRSYNAARTLMQNGFKNVAVLSGGTSFYKSMHHNDAVSDSEQNKEKECQEENNDMDLSPFDAAKANRETKILDCCGLQCPGPIMKVNETMRDMQQDEILQVCSTDMGFARDIDSWCKRTGNTLMQIEKKDKENIVYIKKGAAKCDLVKEVELPQGKTIIVFSGDLDKVLASFIIANGAASMGRPVTMFFTFWGLNALRKTERVSLKKSFMDKMFGMMMPRGTARLKLSKMHMAGMGTKMMKRVMQNKNIDSLEALMKQAMANGVKLVACTMSMDVMGIQKDELIDGIDYAGVASYLSDAEDSNVNLFI